MMIETSKLYILISVGMALSYIQGHSCMKIKTVSFHFLGNFSVDLDEIICVAPIGWFFEAHAKFILYKIYSRERTVLA